MRITTNQKARWLFEGVEIALCFSAAIFKIAVSHEHCTYTLLRFFLQTYNVLEAEKACVGEYNRTVYGKLLLVILYLPILICADFSV